MKKEFCMYVSKSVLAIITIIVLSCQSLYPLIIFNRGDESFVETNAPNSIGSSGATIQNGIIKGAAAFLDSYSHTLSFLRVVEVSEIAGVDLEELKNQIEQAVEDMTLARGIYDTLKLNTEATPYNPDMIGRLRSFEYEDFRASKGLSTAVFAKVAIYLKKGDVRGAFGKLLTSCETVLKMLTCIQTEVDSGQFPNIEKLWRLNDAFSDTLRFGQYAAEVFIAIGN